MAAQAATFLAMLVAVRNVKPVDFGTFAVPWSATVICNGTLYNGFYQHLLRTRDLESARDTDFWLLLAEGLLCASVLQLIAFALHRTGSPEMAHAFVLLSPAVVLGSICAWYEALLTRATRIGTCAVLQLVAECSGLAVLLAGSYMGGGLHSLIAWRLVGAVVGTLGLALASRELPRLAFHRDEAVRGLREAIPLQGSALLGNAATYVADFSLAAFLSPAATGSFRVATRFSATAGNVFLDPLRSVTWMTLAEAERRADKIAMQRALLNQAQLVSLLAWPILAGLALLGGRLFPLVASQDWEDAGLLVQLLALARIPDVLSFFLDPLLICRNQPRLRFHFRTIATVVNVAGIALMSTMGVVNVAVWQIVYSLCIGLISLYLMGQFLQLRARQLVSAMGPAVLSAAVCVGLGEVAYRASTAAPALRVASSMLTMGVIAGGTIVALYLRGTLTLPRVERSPVASAGISAATT